MSTYRLLDCGDQKKVEYLGDFKVIRPCPQALWPLTKPELWLEADTEFHRQEGEKGKWKALKVDPDVKRKNAGMGIPSSWIIESKDDLKWEIEPNEFGNIGVFTEHWTYAPGLVDFFDKKGKILNLFSYSGSNCVALAKAGFTLTVVDSSKSAMETYTKNLEINKVKRDGQRLILEDVYKFIAREVRRENKYDGIMVDAPSYGRGTKGEVFKIEDDLTKLLEICKQLLSPNGKIVLTLHSPRFTPLSLEILCQQIFKNKTVSAVEIVQHCESGIRLPSGFLVKIA